MTCVFILQRLEYRIRNRSLNTKNVPNQLGTDRKTDCARVFQFFAVSYTVNHSRQEADELQDYHQQLLICLVTVFQVILDSGNLGRMLVIST